MAEKPRERGEAPCTLRERERADVNAAKQNRAVLHVPEGGDEPGDGGLAAAGRADETDDLMLPDRKTRAGERFALAFERQQEGF